MLLAETELLVYPLAPPLDGGVGGLARNIDARRSEGNGVASEGPI